MARKKKYDHIHADSLKHAIDVLAKGYSTGEAIRSVADYRKENGLSVKEDYIKRIVAEANSRLSKEFGKDKAEVIAIHVERYNNDINRLLSVIPEDNPDNTDYESEYDFLLDGDFESQLKKRERKIAAFFQALATMYAKEKVLQMHSKSFLVFISNKVNLNIQEKPETYDFSKLTKEQKIDFLNLILKAKQNEFEVGSVILRGDNKQDQTIDIEHEVVEEEPNVNKIKLIEPEPNLVPPRTGTALLDVNAKLREALQKSAIEQLKKAGSKTVEEDERQLQQMQPKPNNRK